jgi:hypothetical protein
MSDPDKELYLSLRDDHLIFRPNNPHAQYGRPFGAGHLYAHFVVERGVYKPYTSKSTEENKHGDLVVDYGIDFDRVPHYELKIKI